MGTKIDCKSYLPEYYTMRDLNEDSSSSSWPQFYGDKPVTNGQYYNGFTPGILVDGYPAHDKDVLKQKILEHEAVFKNQVCELHRLYRIQRDMMEEVKRKELHNHRASVEPSSSSTLQGPQVPSEDARKWHMAGFPLSNSGYGKTGNDIANSPMSCTKGYNPRPGQVPFSNGSTSKDFEALESRPLKVRKKLFDLQLPADEYIDTEEGEKLRGSIGLADLNEPIRIEEATAASSSDFRGHTSIDGETKGVLQNGRTNAGYLGVTRESNGFMINASVESKVNERGRLLHLYESGSRKNNLSSTSQGRQPDKLPVYSYPSESMLNHVHRPGIYPSGYNSSHLEPMASQNPGSYPFFSSSFPSSWTHSVSSWEKPTSSFAQKMTTFEPSLNSAAAINRNLHSFPQSLETFGGKWQANASSSKTINGFYHSSASGSRDMQVHLPSAGIDYLNCSRGDKLASDHSTNPGFGIFQKGSSCAHSKPAIDINLNEVVEVQDLNTVDGKSKLDDHLSALPWLKPKPANDASSSKLCCKNEIVGDLNQLFIPSEVVRESEVAETQNVKKILGVPISETVVQEKVPSSLVSTSASLDCRSEKENVNIEKKKRMIDINLACEPDEDTAIEGLTTEIEMQRKDGASVRDHIDLNVLVSDCEDPPAPSYESKGASVRIALDIDLEVPALAEDEDDNILSTVNMTHEASLQSLENKNEQIQDEVLRNAAETMLSISSYCPQRHADDSICHPSEVTLAESLLWFVDACANELEKEPRDDGSPKQDSLEEIDEFEAMTLQLAETKEEDYMPKPFFPEVQEVEEETRTNALPTRPRRGQSRRGRPRRDFQRDILPGLTSLSRHEVTEDIQTFGGMMRATGHSWNSGLTRRNGTRNGGGRGRRRTVVETGPTVVSNPISAPLVQQHSNIEAGLEDRSLTGWGKTTRRPRRQRCPAGNNPPTVVIT